MREKLIRSESEVCPLHGSRIFRMVIAIGCRHERNRGVCQV